jgi:uncharacterized protein (DUF2147 family)
MNLKTFFAGLCMLAFMTLSATAQSTPVGVWKTIDDVSGEAKSHLEIFQKDGKLYAKIVKLLLSPEDKVCDACPGDKQGKPLMGMEILWDLEPYDDYWSYGKIMDPESGKVYKCNLEMVGNDELAVRGYIGFSLLGRNQSWFRVK